MTAILKISVLKSLQFVQKYPLNHKASSIIIPMKLVKPLLRQNFTVKRRWLQGENNAFLDTCPNSLYYSSSWCAELGLYSRSDPPAQHKQMLKIGKVLSITFVLENLARGTGARKPEQFGHESKGAHYERMEQVRKQTY